MLVNPRFSSPFSQAILLIVAMAVSLVSVTALSQFCAPLLGFSSAELSQGVTASNLSLSWYLLAIQSFAMFLLPPFLAAKFIVPRFSNVFLGTLRKPLIISSLRSVLMVLIAMPFISFASSANALLPLPQWAADMEAAAKQLTEQLLSRADAKSFLLNLLVMAVLPAVSEELFFRGYVQRVMRSWVKNPHWAILVTAVFFSAFHLQFAGFVPRFLLGAMLGYLFYWSGSLWLSVIAHFTNNAIAVCAYFYAARSSTPLSDENVGIFSALLSVVLTAYLMYGVFFTEKMRRKRRVAKEKMGGDFTPKI
jgi:membrane protease YdiL (CAAX protease family)